MSDLKHIKLLGLCFLFSSVFLFFFFFEKLMGGMKLNETQMWVRRSMCRTRMC